jgi:signal transduction histidine kinase
MSWWRSGRRTPAWWLAGLVAGGLLATDVAGQASNGALSGTTVTFALMVLCGVAVGLWSWAWRSATGLGPLAYAWPVLYLPFDLILAFPSSRLILTAGLASYNIGGLVVSQLTLAYPRTRIDSRAAFWFLLLAGYLAQAVQNLGNLLWWPGSYLYTGPPPWFSLDGWNRGWTIQIIVAMPILLAFTLNRLRHASRGARRTMGPLIVVGAGTGVAYVVYLLSILYHKQSWFTLESYVLNLGQIAFALAALLGLLATRRARGAVGDLVVELGEGGPASVRDALSRAVGDPTLELLLWLPDRHAWAAESGVEVRLPENGDRAVTLVGEGLAAIVHDPVFLDQPALIEAAGSAARFALENERLQAQLRAQLAELRDSRAKVVRSADEERRRLERDLHDGAQQRLLGLGMALQLLRTRVEGDSGAEALVRETEAELRQALSELRELARGIHPAVLTDQGLYAAVRTLADRARLPVEVQDSAELLPPHVETAAYFVVAEALANIAKYAHATRAWVTLSQLADGQLLIEVRDDGVGGADPADGSGLRGLADRVGALDGHLAVESPPGGGTRIRAEIPCAS